MVALLGMTALWAACSSGRSTEGADTAAAADDSGATSISVAFDADSAMSYVRRQVEFGPRVPGSAGHKACGDWLVSELRRHGADTVIEQEAVVTAHNGDRLPIRNIMARYNPSSRRRVLLLAHWDTRPWADEDPDPANRAKPLPGANDGASGVGALLEIARQLKSKSAPVGVDILFVDAEDYGQSGGSGDTAATWCLGTQYWTANMPYSPNELPLYAVCLDMVGGVNAVFHREFFSNMKARSVVDKIWATAARAGYGDRFVNDIGGSIVDDHIFINEAGIPAVDIIECVNRETRSFPPTWHTMADDVDHIDPASLKAAGQTVINTVFNEI